MMIPGLTAAEERRFLAALNVETARTSTRVDVLDLNHRHLGAFDDALTDATVQHNRRGDIERQASATLIDPDDDLAELDLRHLVQLRQGVETVNDAGDREMLWCPVFTGRIMRPTDDGHTATLDLHGKDSFGLQAGFPVRNWGKGMPLGRVVHDMFEDIGETRFRIPRALREGGPRLTSRISSGGPDERKAPTRVARRICRGELQIFWDGPGYLVVRRAPENPLVVWTDADDQDEDLGSAATSPIRWDRPLSEIRNTVVAKGKGKDNRVIVDADDLIRGHIYSPRRLERGGLRRAGQLRHYVTFDKIARERRLRQAALRELRRVLAEWSQASLECVPTYHVGTHDLVRAVRRDGRMADFYLEEATIPLTGDGAMTVGYQQVQRKRRGRRARVLT